MVTCNSTNTQSTDQTSFFDHDGVNWDPHRIGWVVAGVMAVVTVVITFINVTRHCLHYNNPLQQRQIIRILFLPAVYAVVSFLSYRFFRSFTYYSLAETVYEALAIAAFLLLLVQYIGDTPMEQRNVLGTKDKRKVPFPFCCWRYRPSKPYFLNSLKWSVLQYVFFRPLITIVAIVCEATNTLCDSIYSVHFAAVYLDSFDFVVFSIALYGLIIFYTVTKDNLKGRNPLSKFLTIKGIVFFTFYQGFVFSILQDHGTIKATTYWTATNVADGLQALCTTVEMVIFATIMTFTFSSSPYRAMSPIRTNPLRSFLHSQNYWDFVRDFFVSLGFYWDYFRGKPYTHSSAGQKKTGRDGEGDREQKGMERLDGRPGGFDFRGAYRYEEEGAGREMRTV